MSLQYIKDDKGNTTGVFIPIREWNEINAKYEAKEQDVHELPNWQKEIVRKRIKNTKPEEYISWEEVRRRIKPG